MEPFHFHLKSLTYVTLSLTFINPIWVFSQNFWWGRLAFGDNFRSLSGTELDGGGGLASGMESDGGLGKKQTKNIICIFLPFVCLI